MTHTHTHEMAARFSNVAAYIANENMANENMANEQMGVAVALRAVMVIWLQIWFTRGGSHLPARVTAVFVMD